ncbi:hypothetical protein A2276_01885 [candidate division WOR-1 bacterium RIFOXYA12_FULL_43_27]|uniref:Glutamate-1-semialdehyde 2,1-aminomutase n=1 Tax=candidate division WOR-1 bacterium RIFOXYC2_FULL_46_14 TaxID=1802587 RepID=A0A1F4U8H3_UNCSA|nr:MAG: hypothetical protein A2276_01885 [candidate division WOR-1 bacterium RIFOXYA12_FULL_43_27]OGC19527.1 MAG: hypothetical protein A2292_02445 [candidate division WOR-1 bacterium RIFOXYB2_FULL_46_45]OGC30515.1 MAG: hypothetical protein A2232_02445 [candidate division WOR-1 bacterium RIFOXYA2_FULL_46_56]OGC40583.1 MAG: hypothetical protein A2438_06160 [candidate division WOR-1 bacterium RIFOXYC2_FULL_46_14]
MDQRFAQAKKYLVGGVNSPVRAFGAVGGEPIFIKRGQGAEIRDQNNRKFIDYVMSWGALILGHAHPKVVAAVTAAVKNGSSFGAPTEKETELAKMICGAFPSIEKVRFVSSGTEAVMGALKLAFALTGRKKVIKFRQCYHGWSEQDYLEAEYNNLGSVKNLVSDKVAAIIVEPVAGNSGVIAPKSGFLEGLRKICDKNKIILIFDEVITGFRVAYGGAQELYKVKADLTCLGKIIGGGFPLAAFGGRKGLMDQVAPLGLVYQAGTLSGNPVAVAAGIEVLKTLKDKKIYKDLEEKTRYLCEGMKMEYSRVGSMFSFKFNDRKEYAGFFWRMIEKGFYFAPSKDEANFISTAHARRKI